MPKQIHEDFGEKIGGAKKDLWSVRGLYVDDLDEMNEREAEKYVKKDNVWKKPDYQAMLDDGIPLGVVFYIKKVRDAVPATPRYYRVYDPEDKYYQQKQYITTVRQLQEVIEKVRNVEDAKAAFADFYVKNGYLRSIQDWNGRTAYERTGNHSHNPALTENLRYTIRITSTDDFVISFKRLTNYYYAIENSQKVQTGMG